MHIFHTLEVRMAKYNQKTLTGIYKRIVGAMSGLADIDVRIHAQTSPHWNPEDRSVNMPLSVFFADNDEEDFTFGRGIVVHESSHVLFCPPFEPDSKDLAEWFNVFADCNNEWKTTQLWPHLKQPLAAKTQALVKKRPAVLTSDNPFMQVIMRCDKVSELSPEFPENYDPDLVDFVEWTTKSFHTGNIAEATGDELIEFCKSVNDRWQKLTSTKKQEGAKGSTRTHKLMKELGDLIKSGASKEAIQKKQEQIAKSSTKKELFKQGIDRTIIGELGKISGTPNYNNLSLEELKEKLKEAKPGKVGETAQGGWGCDEIPQHNVVTGQPYHDSGFEIDKSKAYKQGKKINRALRRKIHLQEDYEKRHRSGRIDFNEVRRQVGQLGQIFKENIFERNNTFTRGGQWAVEVLVDCSGSMNGRNKMWEAKQAMATLAYALDGLPNVKYALTGFNFAQDVQEMPVKRFQDRKFDMRKLSALYADGGNCDGHNILAAAKRLNKFRNIKKLLVVISDGQPAYQNGIDHTKKAVEVAERFGIRVLGIGIEGCTEKALEHIYPNRYLFENTENLHQELTGLILSALGQRDAVKLVKRAWER
jgi:hypothetical protein|tara:strand:+ start:4025 stop:5794 length:1770 start_codon:yes stop_codon:yes gene_type:complete